MSNFIKQMLHFFFQVLSVYPFHEKKKSDEEPTCADNETLQGIPDSPITCTHVHTF